MIKVTVHLDRNARMDRADAIFAHLFGSQRRLLEGAPGPWVQSELLPDTMEGLPSHMQAGGYYADNGVSMHWPRRWLVSDLALTVGGADVRPGS